MQKHVEKDTWMHVLGMGRVDLRAESDQRSDQKGLMQKVLMLPTSIKNEVFSFIGYHSGPKLHLYDPLSHNY